MYEYVNQGLFERHKLIVSTQMCMLILAQQGQLDRTKFEFLLKAPKVLNVDNPVSDWVTDVSWATVQALRDVEEYSGLPDDMVGSAKRWLPADEAL